MMDAIKLFTIGGAHATNEEHLKGTITRGKLADIVILERTFFENPDDLLRTKVEDDY